LHQASRRERWRSEAVELVGLSKESSIKSGVVRYDCAAQDQSLELLGYIGPPRRGGHHGVGYAMDSCGLFRDRLAGPNQSVEKYRAVYIDNGNFTYLFVASNSCGFRVQDDTLLID
jgi:hypothetical protein